MKYFSLIAAFFLTAVSLQADPLELGGATWESSWTNAVQRARAENKPILHFQLLGRLDEKWC